MWEKLLSLLIYIYNFIEHRFQCLFYGIDNSTRLRKGNTTAMTYVLTTPIFHNPIPPIYYNHDPTLRNIEGMTVAMLLASKGVEVPRQWLHDPKLCNRNGRTVAMMYEGIDFKVPKCW